MGLVTDDTPDVSGSQHVSQPTDGKSRNSGVRVRSDTGGLLAVVADIGERLLEKARSSRPPRKKADDDDG